MTYLSVSEYAQKRGISDISAMALFILAWDRRQCELLLMVIKDGEVIDERPFLQGFFNVEGQKDPDGYGYNLVAIHREGLLDILDFWRITKPELTKDN